MRIAYWPPNTCASPMPLTRLTGSCRLVTRKSAMSGALRRRDVSYSATISALTELALRTVMPCCCTCCGSRDSACCTRFCTCTWAVSGLVPGAKLTVICDWPLELLLALM